MESLELNVKDIYLYCFSPGYSFIISSLSLKDIPQFKRIRQWLFQCGYIQYIIDDQIWSADNTNPVQLSHFRAKRPCHVSLIKRFDARDIEDDKEDEFLDYIENCSGKFVFIQRKPNYKTLDLIKFR